MSDVYYIDRKTKKKIKEQIPAERFLAFLYESNPASKFLRAALCHFPAFSSCFGSWQKRASSKNHIAPFIKKYNIDEREFLDPLSSYTCFNDFFTRKLKYSARPIINGNDVAIMPSDGRFLAFQDVQHEEGIFVKGKTFSLEKLLGDAKLAHKYSQGAMVIARLAPVDYHRFHFPTNCVPSRATLINGPLYSVNPIALRENIEILTENKRVITHLKTHHFGTVLMIEVGATNVGSIIQTYTPDEHYAKGDEKGYFSFGGSCIIMLFEPFRIELDRDVLENTRHGFETYTQMGQSLGRALQP